MSVTTHDEHILDRPAMVAMKGFMKSSAGPVIAPEGRPAYDELTEHTPAPENVTWTATEIAGVSGWLCRPADAVPGRAILYLHGGCYVLGSASGYRGLASQVAAQAKAVSFVADYRLAPENLFPAAFDDARKALDGLQAEGFDKIAVVGDSAGGGLGLAVLASSATTTKVVAASLFSPWIDLSLESESLESRSAFDPILSRTVLQQGADQYLSGADPRDSRANALAGNLSILPPIRIDVGNDEVLLDDAIRFGAAANAAQVPCEVHVWEGMMHVFPANVMLKAAQKALNDVGAFLETEFSRPSES